MELYEILERRATNSPDKVAITHNHESVTYGILKKKIEDFAISLPQKTIDNPTVAILLPPSIDFVVAIFACQKKGYTYLPLDINQPSHFLTAILSNADVRYVITHSHLRNLAQIIVGENGDVINIEHELNDVRSFSSSAVSTTTNEIAYIIYTSGSTGAPKGVPIKNKSVLNLVNGTKNIYKINEEDRIPLFHALNFDVSVWEIYSTLLNGAHLVIVPELIKKSPQDYWQFISTNGITIINLTPAYFYLLLPEFIVYSSKNHYFSTNLKLILLAGEAFHAKKIRSWFKLEASKKIDIFNMYGITEGTVHSTFLKIEKKMSSCTDSPIGQPLPGVEIAIVDKNNLPVSASSGELCLSGVSVTPGYLNQNILNQDRFISCNLDGTTEKIWFKTGDLVQQKEAGLIYLGRKDNLVKIRGYRINLLEIEEVLCKYIGVENAVVTTVNLANDQLRLMAFVLSSDKTLNEQHIFSILKQQLPEHMCPSRIVMVTQFPLTCNGKVDTKALTASYVTSDFVLQQNCHETSALDKIKYAWMKTLGRDDIDINTNFFDMGGDSLLLAKLQYFLQTFIGIEIKIFDLLKYPTINKFLYFINPIICKGRPNANKITHTTV